MQHFIVLEYDKWMKPIVAAFDFDGTLTRHDTLLPFLNYVQGPLLTAGCVIRLLPALLKYLARSATRQELKETLLTAALAGMPIHVARRFGIQFAQGPLQKLIKPKGLECLRRHQQQGHRCILVSANLDLYLETWGESMGFDSVLTSQCAMDKDGLLTGRLEGLNCRGPEKVDRLTALLGPRDTYILYAYGDSTGDREMLGIADHPYYRSFDHEEKRND